MIVSRGVLKLLNGGMRYFDVALRPKTLREGRPVRLRTSKRDPGTLFTVDRIFQFEGRWRIVVRKGDCTEHTKLLTWSGRMGSGEDSEHGYTEDSWRAMQDEPEAVDGSWLKQFREAA